MKKNKRRELIKKKYFEDVGEFSYDEYSNNTGFLDKLNLELVSKVPPKNYKVDSSNRKRLMVGFAILLVLMFALIFRMGYWQVIKADDLKVKATQMQKVDTEIDAERGSIYDSKMNTLAETVTEYELYGYTQYLYKGKDISNIEKEKVVSNLVELSGQSEKEIKKKLESKENLVLLADGLDKNQVDKAEKLWGSNVVVKTKVSRYYPNGAFAAQLLGGVNAENNGRTGLEYEYNSVLAGIKGRTVKTTDSQGNTLANGNSKLYEAQDGYSIVTSIDSVIQHYVEDAVASGMKRTGASSITCIVMNPKTGEILALAETPEYDPNVSNQPSNASDLAAFKKMSASKQSEYLSRMWTIEPISNIYEPGSTFKLIAAASALETGNANNKSTYTCKGYIDVDGTKLGCLGHHGTQSLKVAVGNSCNAALGRVALDMGADTFYNYIELFGFRDKTRIDLPGETESIVKSPVNLVNVDLATTGYGQGIAITPIQMLCAVNSLGNGGVLLQPRVVNKIVDKDGKTIEKFDKTEVRQVVSEKTASEMCEIMEYYVSDAGGDKAYVPGYRVGGKTGTANIAANGGYSEKTDCSFIAMAPMDDPQISMLVIVHKPTKTQYGNNSAGPIIKEIMEKSLMYMGVERKYTEKEAKIANKNRVKVPKLTGMDSKKAIAELNGKGLKYKIQPEAKSDNAFIIKDQYPKAGEKVTKGTTVYIYSE